MSKDEVAKFKNPPPITTEGRKKMADAFANQTAKVGDEQAQWRKDHPEEAAKMDADRAKAGLPPIGR